MARNRISNGPLFIRQQGGATIGETKEKEGNIEQFFYIFAVLLASGKVLFPPFLCCCALFEKKM
jgi:hypothetical protein